MRRTTGSLHQHSIKSSSSLVTRIGRIGTKGGHENWDWSSEILN